MAKERINLQPAPQYHHKSKQQAWCAPHILLHDDQAQLVIAFNAYFKII